MPGYVKKRKTEMELNLGYVKILKNKTAKFEGKIKVPVIVEKVTIQATEKKKP